MHFDLRICSRVSGRDHLFRVVVLPGLGAEAEVECFDCRHFETQLVWGLGLRVEGSVVNV